MAIFDYKCDNTECNFTEEYGIGPSLPKSFNPPEVCPKCNTGKMIQLFTPQGQSFDIIGWCYENEHGKHAWKKNMSVNNQAKVLAGEMDPY